MKGQFRRGNDPVVMTGEIIVTVQQAHDIEFVNPNDPNKGEHKTIGQKVDEVLEQAAQAGYVKEFTIKMPESIDA